MRLITNAEHNALSPFVGPRITQAELDTRIHLQQMTEVTRQVNATPFAERLRRSRAAMDMVEQAQNIEAVRAGIWAKMPLSARRVACLCANMPKERAMDELNKFNAFERTRIWTAIDNLVDDLEKIKRCMNGGVINTLSDVSV